MSRPSVGGRASSSPPRPASSQCAAAMAPTSAGLRHHGRDRRAAAGAVEQGQRGGVPAEHGDAQGLQQLGGGADVEDGLGARAHHHRGGAGDLRQVAGDVQAVREAAVHPADAAGGHEPDAHRRAHRERAADGGGAERALDDAGRDVAGAHLPGVGAGGGEPLELRRAEPDPDRPVDDPDRGRHRPGRPGPLLGRPGRQQAAAAGEPVRDQRGLHGHHRPALAQCLRHLIRNGRRERHGMPPMVATARAAALRPRSTPPSRYPAANASPAPVESTGRSPPPDAGVPRPGPRGRRA